MVKKSRSARFPKLIKNPSATGLIVLLALALMQLIGNVHSTPTIKLPSSEESLELYSNELRDDLTSLYKQSIEEAQESITLYIYSLTDQSIINALRQKSEAGIPVFIVCDAKASPGLSAKIPKATCISRAGKGIMHNKILVVDQKQILMGSANLTYSSLKVHGNLVIGLKNPALADILCKRAKQLDEEGSKLDPVYYETSAGIQNIEFWALPNDPLAVNRLTALIRSAKKTIRVAMFTWTRVDFTKELIAASKRGIKVEAVIDRYSGKGAGAKVVSLLTAGGIRVTLSTGKGLLHHKFAYIDSNILVNGSANWTLAGFRSNDDNFIVIDPLTTEQQEKMDRLWEVIKKNSASPQLKILKATGGQSKPCKMKRR